MISVKTNIGIISISLLNKLAILRNPKPLLRPVALDVLSLMKERIHDEGKAADGRPLGNYTSRYLKFRTDNGRPGNPKKLSFTRQLQNSLGVIGTEKGFAIGLLIPKREPLNNYLNKKNKAKGSKAASVVTVNNAELINYLEAQAGKKIWALSAAEKEYAITKLKSLLNKKLNS